MRRNVILVAAAGLADGIGLLAALVWIGRALGPADYGQFAAAYALVMLVSVIAEAGVAAAVTRGVARDRVAGGDYAGHALALRLLLAAAVIGLSVALAQVAFGDERVWLSAILALYAALASVSHVGDAIFRAHERMDLTLVGIVVERGALLAGLALVPAAGLSATGAAAALAFSGAARVVAVVGPTIRLAGLPRLRLDPAAWMRLLGEALPIGVAAALVSVSWRVGTIMLALLLPERADVVGTYNAAYTMFGATLLAAGAIATPIFPVVSRLYATEPARIAALCRRAATWLAVVGVGAALGLYVTAAVIVETAYGARFQDAVPLLRILAIALLMTYAVVFVRTVLPAIDRAWQAVGVLALGAGLNVGLNILLIPRWGGVGAAWSVVASETAAAALGSVVLARHLRAATRVSPRAGRAWGPLERPASGPVEPL